MNFKCHSQIFLFDVFFFQLYIFTLPLNHTSSPSIPFICISSHRVSLTHHPSLWSRHTTQHNTAQISKSFISDRLLIPMRGEDHREPICVPNRKKKILLHTTSDALCFPYQPPPTRCSFIRYLRLEREPGIRLLLV